MTDTLSEVGGDASAAAVVGTYLGVAATGHAPSTSYRCLTRCDKQEVRTASSSALYPQRHNFVTQQAFCRLVMPDLHM